MSATTQNPSTGIRRSQAVVSRVVADEAIVVPIPEGTTQIQQLIIGRALTGVNAF